MDAKKHKSPGYRGGKNHILGKREQQREQGKLQHERRKNMSKKLMYKVQIMYAEDSEYFLAPTKEAAEKMKAALLDGDEDEEIEEIIVSEEPEYVEVLD